MYATISIPGSQYFAFKHFDMRPGHKLDEAVKAWRSEWLKKNGNSRAAEMAVRDGLLVSDRSALATKYKDGSCPFAPWGALLGSSDEG